MQNAMQSGAICFLVLLICTLFGAVAWAADESDQVPVLGMVNLVDFGANTCIPCKMMAPILDDLKEEYEGRAEITFIDINEQRGLARSFSIRLIPTQIFFDKNGIEVGRHEGYLEKEQIVSALKQLGVE